MQTVTIISSLIGAMALIAGSQTYWLSRGLDALGGRMDRLDFRMDRLDVRMDRLDVRMDRLENRMDRLEGRVDGLTQRLDHQSDVILREHGERLARLEAQGE